MMNGLIIIWISTWPKPADIELGYIFIGSCNASQRFGVSGKFVKRAKNCAQQLLLWYLALVPVKQAAEN